MLPCQDEVVIRLIGQIIKHPFDHDSQLVLADRLADLSDPRHVLVRWYSQLLQAALRPGEIDDDDRQRLRHSLAGGIRGGPLADNFFLPGRMGVATRVGGLTTYDPWKLLLIAAVHVVVGTLEQRDQLYRDKVDTFLSVCSLYHCRLIGHISRDICLASLSSTGAAEGSAQALSDWLRLTGSYGASSWLYRALMSCRRSHGAGDVVCCLQSRIGSLYKPSDLPVVDKLVETAAYVCRFFVNTVPLDAFRLVRRLSYEHKKGDRANAAGKS